jgi:Zn-dependent protease
MTEHKTKIDKFIDEQFRTAKVEKAKPELTSFVMKRVIAEQKYILEERKQDRVIKYSISSILALVFGFVIFVSFSTSESSSASDKFNMSPAIESTNSFFTQLVEYAQNIALGVLGLIGVSYTNKTFSMILLIAAAIGLFLAAERFLVRPKLKSRRI